MPGGMPGHLAHVHFHLVLVESGLHLALERAEGVVRGDRGGGEADGAGDGDRERAIRFHGGEIPCRELNRKNTVNDR
jgi:hypothetical protein